MKRRRSASDSANSRMRFEAEVSDSPSSCSRGRAGELRVGEAGGRIEADARFADLHGERRRRTLQGNSHQKGGE